MPQNALPNNAALMTDKKIPSVPPGGVIGRRIEITDATHATASMTFSTRIQIEIVRQSFNYCKQGDFTCNRWVTSLMAILSQLTVLRAEFRARNICVSFVDRIATGRIRYQELRWRETMSDETYYTALGIPETATQDEIDRAHRNFIEAYHVLSDSTQRLSYDQQLAQRRRQNAPAPTAPPEVAAVPPPPSFTSLPSARLQLQAGKRIDWRYFAPLAGILLLLSPMLIMLLFFDKDLALLMCTVCFLVTVIVMTVFILTKVRYWLENSQ
jgi:hypothetical protein